MRLLDSVKTAAFCQGEWWCSLEAYGCLRRLPIYQEGIRMLRMDARTTNAVETMRIWQMRGGRQLGKPSVSVSLAL